MLTLPSQQRVIQKLNHRRHSRPTAWGTDTHTHTHTQRESQTQIGIHTHTHIHTETETDIHSNSFPMTSFPN